jgi:hypothetical protein
MRTHLVVSTAAAATAEHIDSRSLSFFLFHFLFYKKKTIGESNSVHDVRKAQFWGKAHSCFLRTFLGIFTSSSSGGTATSSAATTASGGGECDQLFNLFGCVEKVAKDNGKKGLHFVASCLQQSVDLIGADFGLNINIFKIKCEINRYV